MLAAERLAVLGLQVERVELVELDPLLARYVMDVDHGVVVLVDDGGRRARVRHVQHRGRLVAHKHARLQIGLRARGGDERRRRLRFGGTDHAGRRRLRRHLRLEEERDGRLLVGLVEPADAVDVHEKVGRLVVLLLLFDNFGARRRASVRDRRLRVAPLVGELEVFECEWRQAAKEVTPVHLVIRCRYCFARCYRADRGAVRIGHLATDVLCAVTDAAAAIVVGVLERIVVELELFVAIVD